MAAEHRRLDGLFADMRTMLRRARSVAFVAHAFDRLRAGLESHLVQEDQLYYPTVWTLTPGKRPALLAFGRAHEEFRGVLAEVGDLIASGALGDAERTFTAFSQAFAQHEECEEALLVSLERQIIHPGP